MRIPCRGALLLLLLLAAAGNERSYGQATTSSNEPYNRIRFHHDHWQVLHAPSCSVYFPKGSDSLCAFVLREFPEAAARIRERVGTGITGVPNIILYPSADQLYESNIGGSSPQEYALPTFVTKGSRMLLSYDGSYAGLTAELYEAIARSVWQTQLGSASLAAQAKSSTPGELVPYWFSEGAIRYLAEGWPVEREDALRALWNSDSLTFFGALVGKNAALTGQAFSYYLCQKYRPDAVKQVLFQLRKRKPLPRALRLVAKRDAGGLYSDCFAWMQERFGIVYPVADTTATTTKDEVRLRVPLGKRKKRRTQRGQLRKGQIISFLLSPNAQQVAWTVAAPGHQRKVFVCDMKSGRRVMVCRYKLPPWLTSYEQDRYPLLSWDEHTGELLIIRPGKGKITIERYSSDGAQAGKTVLPLIDGAGSVSAGQDSYLLAAWLKGQDDIVSYDPSKEKYTPLTADRYDDSQPAMDGKGGSKSSGLYFISERPKSGIGKDSLRPLQGIYELRGASVHPVFADTLGYASWSMPVPLPDGRLLALTTKSGRQQIVLVHPAGGSASRYEVLADAVPFQYLPASGQIAFFVPDKDSLTITLRSVSDWIAQRQQHKAETTGPWLRDYRHRLAVQRAEDSLLKAARDNGGPSFLDGVLTQPAASSDKHKDSLRRDSMRLAGLYSAKRVRPYVLQLYSAYFTTRVNNDYFTGRYQPYLNYQGSFKFPEAGGLVQGGLTDLFENHHFTIAYRLPAATEGSDFSVRYGNTARRLGWGLAYYRDVTTLKPDPERSWVDDQGRPYPDAAKVKTHYYEGSLRYPLSYYSGLSFSTAVRQDKTVFLALDNYTLEFPSIPSVWSVSTLSYSFHRLEPTLPYLYRGFTAKANIDPFKGFSQSKATVTALSLHMAYHQPLYKYITLVMQLHGGYSTGKERILYNLGGVDNNLTPKIDSTVHFGQDAPYAFQTLVTPFRGYLQNSLYGDRYGLVNADVYFPLFTTLIPIETDFPSLNNLQPGLFADGATAKQTFHAAYTGQYKWSFGASLRTVLAGYPLRFDIGWPGTFGKAPVWYFSLNLQ